jgi:predicted RNase H-like HicB family nuclease
MKRKTDIYHRWVAWSEEDQTYIGRCPDLFQGGVHGDDPIKVARALQKVIDEWEDIFNTDRRQLPPARVKPTMELV